VALDALESYRTQPSDDGIDARQPNGADIAPKTLYARAVD
jgi:hypothetical protein